MTMHGTRQYPDSSSGPFPAPPTTFEDREGRTIEVRPLPRLANDHLEAVVDMYTQFSPEDRAQGIPPTGEARIRDWLEMIDEKSVNVVACHDESVVGHAVLVPDVDDSSTIEYDSDVEWELAIFVIQAYQRAGIGTQLLEGLLGHAAALGIEHVWLTVERWNGPAIGLYERVGFEATGIESFEQEMAITLETDA